MKRYTRIITIKLPSDLAMLVTTLSLKLKVSRSELIRRAIVAYVKQLEQEEGISSMEVKSYELR
jgi:Ribbon-helix-helix protein, copG family.